MAKQKKKTSYAITDEFLSSANRQSRFTPAYERMAAQEEEADAASATPTTESTETAPEDMGFWESRVAGLKQDLGELGAVVDAVQAGGYRDLAAVVERVARENVPSNTLGLAATLGGEDLLRGDFDRLAQRFGRDTAAKILAEDIAAFRERAKQNTTAADAVLQPIVEKGGIEGLLARTASDAASSGASSAASLVGGPIGGVTAGTVTYANAYKEALDAGATPNEAEAYALVQGGIEGAVSSIRPPKLLEAIPVVGKFLRDKPKAAAKALAEKLTSPALRAAINSSKTVGGEYVEEAGTNIAQDLAGAYVAGQMQSDAGKELQKRHTEGGIEGLLSRANRAGLAGAAMGGTTTPIHVVGAQAEFDREASEREQRISDQIIRRTGERATDTANQTPSPRQPTSAEAQMELFPETTPGPTSAVPEEAAPAQQPTDRAIDDPEVSRGRREVLRKLRDKEVAKVQELEQSVEDAAILEGTSAYTEEHAQNARELEQSRRRVELLNKEIGKWEGGAAEQLDLGMKTPTQPKPSKPKPIQTRGGDTVYQPDGTVTSNIDTQNRKDAKKLLDEQARADNAAIDKEFKKRKEAHAKERIDYLKGIAEQNRELPAEQRVDALAKAARAWDGSNPIPLREDITLAEATKPAAKGKKGKKPAAPKAPAPTQQEPAKPASKEEEKIKGLADKLGLAMAEEGGKPNTAAPDRAKYERDVRAIVRSLSRSNTQKDIDILNLAEQGKLEFVPNPETVGHKAEGNVRALYRPSEGKMFIYTDRVNPKDATATVIRGYHEGTHGGQFNEREGRGEVLRTLLGDKKHGNVVEIIKKAAANGNKVAKAAVDKAMKNAPEDAELEIPAYFVGEVIANRGRTLGSVAGVARDIMAGAKRAVKTVVGGDPNVSFNDIFSAVNNLGQEIVKTDLKPTKGADREMVYNEGAVTPEALREAIASGRVYTSEDGRLKYILSDAEAVFNDAAIKKLKRGDTVPLHELMQHDTLYRNVPSARDIPVTMASKGGIPADADGMYLGGEIFVNEEVVNGDPGATPLKEIVMHETQHYVQEHGGMGGEFFPGTRIAAAQNRLKLAESANDDATADLLDGVKDFVDKEGNALPSRTKARIMRVVMDSAKSDVAKAGEIATMLEEVALSDMDGSVVDRFHESLKAYRDARENLTDENANYLANITEREAFFTQDMIDATQTEIDLLGSNPEDTMREASTRSEAGRRARGRIDVPSQRARGDLAMAEEADAPVTERWMPAWIRGLFDATKGLGREVNEIIEHAMESPAGDRMRAEASMGKYDFAVDQVAQERGVTSKELNEQIAKDIDELPTDLDGYEANRAAFNAMAKKYGPAGDALMALRDQIDELSMTMIQQRADSGVPLSEKEKKLYQTMLNNLGRYTHRQYVAHAGKLGHKYSKSVFKDYEKYRKGKDKDDPVVKENFSRVADAVKYIVENNLAIPADEELGSLGATQTRRLYTTWIGNPRGVSMEDMKQKLADNRDRINGDTDALIHEAETITKELLDLAPSNSPITSYYRGGKLNTGILQSRTRIPKEIRELMGEVTDPSMRMLMTVAKQAEFVAKNKMFLELIGNPQGDILPPGSRVPKGWKRLSGEAFGPLEGYIVSPNMNSVLGDVTQILATFEQAVAMSARNPKELGQMAINKISDAWSWLAGTSKILQIVWSPMNFAYNLVGGPAIMLMNGNIHPKYLVKGAKDAIGLVSYAIDPKTATPEITELVQNGVVDSAFIGEIKNEQYRDLRKLVREMAGRERNPTMQSIADVLHKGKASIKETYAMMDVLYKIANYHHQKDLLTDFYEANGDTRTDEQIQREASDNTKRTNFTYRRAMPLVKAIEQRGFSAFGPYMNEVFRTQITNILQGISELQRARSAKTPEAAAIMNRQGTARLLGQMLSMGMWSTISYTLGNMTFGEDDDEAEAKRSLLAEYLRDQDFIQVGMDDKKQPVLFNVARFDPTGPATDFIRSAMHGQDPIDAISDKIIDVYIAPRVLPQIVKAGVTMATDKFTTREPLVQQLAPEAYLPLLELGKEIGIPARVTKAWTNVAETLLPGVTNSWRDTNNRPVPSDAVSSAFTALSYSGATMSSLDPSKPIQFAGMDYKKSTELGRKEIAEFFRDSPTRSLESTIAQVLRGRQAEREAYDNAREVYEGARAMGLDDSKINAILKNQRLTKAQIRGLASGNFNSEIISKSSIERYRDFELNDAPKDQHAEIKQKWKDVWSMLRKAGAAIDEEEKE